MPSHPNRPLILRCLAIILPILMMAGTLVFFTQTIRKVSVYANVMPLDSYYYQSFATNIQKGNGPRTDWPQGPQNKYFPGYAYWWALFLPRDMHPDDAVRNYAAPHIALLILLMIGLTILGRMIWKDWAVALSLAALGSAAPILLKWGFVPLSELMATVCLSGIAAGFAYLFKNGERPGSNINETEIEPNQAPIAPSSRKPAADSHNHRFLFPFILCGAIGFLTRMEIGYFLAVLIGILFLTKKMRWTNAAIIGMAAMLPVAIWQMWAAKSLHAPSYYVGEGTNAFELKNYLNHFFYEMLNFLKVQEVTGDSIYVGIAMLLVHLVFLCTLLLALRGYSGRLAAVFAWLILGYWLLHAFWYYRTERYNLLIVPFGFVVFVEGVGRLYHMGKGWFARGGRLALPVLTLLLIPAFWGHSSDNIWQMVAAFNQQKRFPENRKAILEAMNQDMPQRLDLAAKNIPVIVTNISLPEARRLPGVVYFDDVFSKDPCSNLLPPLYHPGKAQEFISQNKVTHLALRPPIDEWMTKNGRRLDVTPIYNDSMVWIGKVNR